jgi:hypothetical protein
MTRRLQQYELPDRFLERFQPVKIMPREKGLPIYLFDAYGLSFYRHMTTAAAIPPEAIWSVIHPEGSSGLRLAHGFTDDAIGYVIAQRCPTLGDLDAYPLPVRLGYRAKVSVQTLQRLRHDLAQANGLAAAEVLTLIDLRINAYHHLAS